MKLTWSAFALSDRDAIFTYIESENPSAAILVDERIVAAVRRLRDFPVFFVAAAVDPFSTKTLDYGAYRKFGARPDVYPIDISHAEPYVHLILGDAIRRDLGGAGCSIPE